MLKKKLQDFGANKVWMVVFGLWILILTGIFTPFTDTPGLTQWMRLRSLLNQKRQKIAELDGRHEYLSLEVERLEKSAAHQEREIRKVLGYVAPGELIFDFSQNTQIQ
ncbi:MAG: septum formation initiator family protein [Xanthomonadaceae bacterium]|nr:septum formation initiator family protein [Xanthomonadaceae bacterium]